MARWTVAEKLARQDGHKAVQLGSWEILLPLCYYSFRCIRSGASVVFADSEAQFARPLYGKLLFSPHGERIVRGLEGDTRSGHDALVCVFRNR